MRYTKYIALVPRSLSEPDVAITSQLTREETDSLISYRGIRVLSVQQVQLLIVVLLNLIVAFDGGGEWGIENPPLVFPATFFCKLVLYSGASFC